MAECGGLLSCAVTPQRRYGSTNNQTFMLVDLDSSIITHKLMPSDTLQGLAIKYGVSVEKLKRVNKLWSNESIHIKESLLIPCAQSYNDQNDPSTLQDGGNSKESQSSNETLTVSGANDFEHNSGEYTSWNDMVSKIDSQIKTYKKDEELGSDSYKMFTEMLSKIDGQIKTHKTNVRTTSSDDVPVVGYDSYKNISGHTSPVKQHPFLEQGI